MKKKAKDNWYNNLNVLNGRNEILARGGEKKEANVADETQSLELAIHLTKQIRKTAKRIGNFLFGSCQTGIISLEIALLCGCI